MLIIYIVEALDSVPNIFRWGTLLPILGLFISHGISLTQNFIIGKEYKVMTVSKAMIAPYARIGVLHLFLLATVIPVIILRSPLFLVIALIILQLVSSGLNLLGVSNFLTIAIWGMIIILVFAVSYLNERYRERWQVV